MPCLPCKRPGDFAPNVCSPEPDLGVPRRLRFSDPGRGFCGLCQAVGNWPFKPQNWILCKVQNSQHFALRREHAIGMKVTRAVGPVGRGGDVQEGKASSPWSSQAAQGTSRGTPPAQMHGPGPLTLPLLDPCELDGHVQGGCILSAFPPCGFHHLFLLIHKLGK